MSEDAFQELVATGLTNIQSAQEQQAKRLTDMHVRQDSLEEILTGNGDPEKGLIVKMDRIEQAFVPDAGAQFADHDTRIKVVESRWKVSKTLLMVFGSTIMAGAGAAVWAALSGTGP